MNIPTPNEFAQQNGYNPFPPKFERWLSSVRQAILSAHPQAGSNVTVDVHPGQGTIVNVVRERGVADVCPSAMTATFSDITICGCIPQGENSVLYTDISINREFTCPFSGEFVPCEFLSIDEDPDLELTGYPTNDCSGDPDFDSDTNSLVDIYFYNGFWHIAIACTFIDDIGFQSPFAFWARIAGSIGSPPSSAMNEITNCDARPWESDPDFLTVWGGTFADYVANGFGGSVATTFTP